MQFDGTVESQINMTWLHVMLKLNQQNNLHLNQGMQGY